MVSTPPATWVSPGQLPQPLPPTPTPHDIRKDHPHLLSPPRTSPLSQAPSTVLPTTASHQPSYRLTGHHGAWSPGCPSHGMRPPPPRWVSRCQPTSQVGQARAGPEQQHGAAELGLHSQSLTAPQPLLQPRCQPRPATPASLCHASGSGCQGGPPSAQRSPSLAPEATSQALMKPLSAVHQLRGQGGAQQPGIRPRQLEGGGSEGSSWVLLPPELVPFCPCPWRAC